MTLYRTAVQKLWRGSYIESFPLYGYDYNELFEEKLDLLLKLEKNETITWEGHHRPSIYNRSVYPRPVQEEILIQSQKRL